MPHGNGLATFSAALIGPLLAHRVISLPRGDSVASELKLTLSRFL
jgi:hypothetical protein